MKIKVPVYVVIAFCVLPFILQAQNPSLSAEKRRMMHDERPADPYLPNAFGNQNVAPGYSLQSSRIAQGSASTIFTTQVNISSNGFNIIGDAANEPSMAISPVNPNEMVIGWRQFDNIASNFRQAGWGFTTNAGQSWTFPGIIEPGVFRSDPVLDCDKFGNFYYNSLTNTPDYFCKVFESSNGGAAWNSGTDAHGGDKQWMTIDRTNGPGSGNIYSSWSSFFSTCAPGFFTRSTDGNITYENCTFVDGDPYWHTMVVGNSGELFIGGGNTLDDSLLVVRSDNAQIPGAIVSWTPVKVFMDGYLSGWTGVNPVGLLGQVSIDVDRSGGVSNGYVYMLASLGRLSNGDPGDVMFVRSTDGGQTWSAPMQINDDPPFSTQWFGTMSVAPNGRIDAIWLDTRDDMWALDSSALYYSFSTDHGISWSVNEKMSPNFDPHTGYPQQDKMGDYFDMVSDNNGAHLAWANTLNGEQDVYYSFITPYTNVGLTEITANHVNIVPNPSNGEFSIIVDAKSFEVTIFNVIGEIVYAPSKFNTKATINLTEKASGIYFIKIVADGTSIVKKIVID